MSFTGCHRYTMGIDRSRFPTAALVLDLVSVECAHELPQRVLLPSLPGERGVEFFLDHDLQAFHWTVGSSR
ncbi:MAG: hypothetical protein ACRD0K_19500 [Egibacteraceae bacterium]